MKHPAESDLALYASRDLSQWQRFLVRFHLRGCDDCKAVLETYKLDRMRLLDSAGDLPSNVNWDRLAAEMTANIRVGLAAGECVAPRVERRKHFSWDWRPIAVSAGVIVLVSAAWFLNMPWADNEALARFFRAITPHAAPVALEERGPVVEASSSGVGLSQNGNGFGIAQSGTRPVTVSVSFQGSASARYIDTDSGQVTITSVYVP